MSKSPACSNCGKEVPASANYCAHCGERVIVPLEYKASVAEMKTIDDFKALFQDIMESANAEAFKLDMILALKSASRNRFSKPDPEVAQLQYGVKDRQVRRDFFEYAVYKITRNEMSLQQCATLAETYLKFRDEQIEKFTAYSPQALEYESIRFYEKLIEGLEGRALPISKAKEIMQAEKDKHAAVARQPHVSTEMQKLTNEFSAATAMITFCKSTRANPKNYIKEARRILETLKRMNYPYISMLEKRLEEKLRE